jgi:hypothetical protein
LYGYENPNQGGFMDRKEIGRQGALERWHPTIPKATHSGILNLAGKEIACDVLADGRRVLRKAAIYRTLGRSKPNNKTRKEAEGDQIPVFMSANNLKTYLERENDGRLDLISYKSPSGQKLQGYDAAILPEVCKMYVKANSDGVLKDDQKHIAKVCEIILCGLATVGIIALVDDATGFVEQRERTELEKLLSAYISEELRQWTSKFPNEFFKQMYRLYGWSYPNVKNYHPKCVGHFINKYIYDRLPPGVKDELKKKCPSNENGNRIHRFHQFLTDVGDKNLTNQIVQTISYMKICKDVKELDEILEKADGNL